MEPLQLIGGPLHGRTIQIADGVRYLQTPTITDRKPKQYDRRCFSMCLYKLKTTSSGRKFLMFIDGYYTPKYNL